MIRSRLVDTEGAVFLSPPLNQADAAVFESFVVPHYLAFFGDMLLGMLLAGSAARIAHLGCRVGYPDRELLERHPGSTIIGIDVSEAALERARHRAHGLPGGSIQYVLGGRVPSALTSQSFSHVMCLHPVAGLESRVALLAEMQRLLYAGGQALIALPLRGSFQEVADLFREYALKQDDGAFGRALEEAVSSRPSLESFSEELEEVGLEDVDIEMRHAELSFDNGRGFLEDPITRMLVIPELQAALPRQDLAAPLEYLRDAIDKYWSEGRFSLTIHAGCASARKPW